MHWYSDIAQGRYELFRVYNKQQYCFAPKIKIVPQTHKKNVKIIWIHFLYLPDYFHWNVTPSLIALLSIFSTFNKYLDFIASFICNFYIQFSVVFFHDISLSSSLLIFPLSSYLGSCSSSLGPRARMETAPSGAVIKMERTARVRILFPMSIQFCLISIASSPSSPKSSQFPDNE